MDNLLDIPIGLTLWILAIALVVTRVRRTKGAGLVLAYLGIFWLHHWLGALIYLLPWHVPIWQPFVADTGLLVAAGFEQSVYAVVSFVVGVIFLGPFLASLYTQSQNPERR